jgi:sialate O-acetylesterase
MTLPKLTAISCPALFLLGAVSAAADVTVANIFNDHMVLQREVPMPVWGTAEAGEEVTVSFGAATKTATAGADGSWSVDLDAMPASAEPRSLKVSGSKSAKGAELKDVLVGEVWLASGQSNMATSAGAPAGMLDTPLVRMGGVPSFYPMEESADLGGRAGWKVATAAGAPGCSGAALYFARGLQAELKVPVGVVVSAVGGTRIESWLRRGALDAAVPASKYRDNMLKEVEAAKSNPTPNPENKAASQIKGTPEWASARLGGRHNGMIAPLARFPVRGFIWYQGEDNARDHAEYAKLLPALIKDWRALWTKELPFLIVQLPAYNADKKPEGTDWAAMREVQERVANAVPNCGIAITCDNDDPGELHPKNKAAVGDRLARVALRQVYGLKHIVASGPVFDSMRLSGPRAVMSFKEDGNGMVSTSGDGLTGFQIAGADKKFVSADARIEGSNVIVSSAQVPEPVAVRYAWVNVPEVSLTNKAGLPAAPFRTDAW